MTATILTIGIPTLAVLIGILLNRNDSNRLDGRISASSAELRAEIAAARKQTHDDVMTLISIGRDQEQRLTRLESRS